MTLSGLTVCLPLDFGLLLGPRDARRRHRFLVGGRLVLALEPFAFLADPIKPLFAIVHIIIFNPII